MNDYVWPGRHDRCPHNILVEAVSYDGFRALSFEDFSFHSRARKPRDRMACRNQRGNQWTTDGTGGACDEDSHDEFLLFRYITYHKVGYTIPS
jgi:hypothetical protein